MRTQRRWLTVGAVLVALLLVSAIPVAADPGIVYVDGTLGTDVALCGGNPGIYACDTIQYAIDNIAVANDTIMVAAGTYTEDLVINTDNLELTATGATIKGVDTELWGSWPLGNPNIEIQADGVKIHGFTIESPDVPSGSYSSGVVLTGTNIEIYGNTFLSKGDGGCVVIQTIRSNVILTSDISGLNIHDNEFGGTPNECYETEEGYVGLFINHTSTGTGMVYVQDNDFTGKICQGVVTERSKVTIADNEIITDLAPSAYGVGVIVQDWDNREQSDVSVSDNVIKGSGAGKGFMRGMSFGTTTQNQHDITVSGNEVTMNATGIRVRSALSGTGVVINFNDIYGNTTWGLDASLASGAVPLDAESNWWGSKSGPDSAANCYTEPGGTPKGDAVGGDVDFAPWLDAAYPAGSDFAPVALDGAWSYSCIQGAIDDATASTIQTRPGTFTESVLVDKSVDILGAGRGVTKLVPSDSYGFKVISDTVKIDGFHIYGNSTTGVWGDKVGGLAVSNNDVDDWGTGMLFQDTKGNLDISGNLVHGNGTGIVLHGDAGPSHIVDNEIYENPVDTGIVILDSEGALVQDNYIHHNDGGLYIEDSEVDVLGNTILDNPGGGTGVLVLGDSDAEIHGNFLEGSAPDVLNASLIPLNATCNWWGGGPPSAGEVAGLVDYDPWIGLAVSADPLQVEANGRAFTTLSGSLVCDGYAVPDGTMVDFETDLGWFTLATLQEVEEDVPTVDGVAKVKLYSYYAGYATITAEAGTDSVEEDRLVTFVPRRVSINNPPHRSTISTRRPTVRWTASPSAVPTLVYQVKLKRLRPRPRKLIFNVVTDQTSYRTPYLRGRVFVVRVRACLDDSLTACSRWRRSKFKIAR